MIIEVGPLSINRAIPALTYLIHNAAFNLIHSLVVRARIFCYACPDSNGNFS